MSVGINKVFRKCLIYVPRFMYALICCDLRMKNLISMPGGVELKSGSGDVCEIGWKLLLFSAPGASQ